MVASLLVAAKFWSAYLYVTTSQVGYDLLLFPEKRLNLILGIVHKSHIGPVSAKAILKSFTSFSEQLPNIIIVY